MRTVDCPLKKKGPKKKWVEMEKQDLETLGRLSNPGPFAAMVVGPVISGAPAILTAKTDYMRLSAILVRMYRPLKPPASGIWSWAANFKEHLFPAFHSPPDCMTDDDWLASMPSNRRKALQFALHLYQRSGWRSKYNEFSTFLKEELMPGFGKDEMGLVPLRTIVARLIHAPHDVTHVIAGPKIKPYMSWLKDQWNKENWVFYGGTSPDKLQCWLDRFSHKERGTQLYFWSDLSQFESTHCPDTWDFIEQFYGQYKHDADFQRCLRAWKQIKSKIGNFKFTGRVGVNASGRPDTAFANGVLNGVGTLLAVTAAWLDINLTNITVEHLLRMEAIMMVTFTGDDTLGSLPYVDPKAALAFKDRCKQHFTTLGFSAKFYVSYKLEDCVYLAHRPLCVAGRWYWAKTLGRCLYKLGFKVGLSGDPSAHMLGVMQMYQRCAAHVPILADIANSWCEATQHNKVNPFKEDPNRPWELMGTFGPGAYDSSTIDALANAYTVTKELGRDDLSMCDVRVTPTDVRDCIKYVRSMVQGVPCVLDHWLLRHMVWVDEQ